mmetsp:Transcript_25420/g.37538  ORF Transcript_25420/g.37538 Transcript_25420/m.37538 type:complete len:350 (-) Transcript_25420:53-1102(-)
MSSTTDPLNVITNPPQTIVKVHGITSREEVNGQLGVAVQYNLERGRYTVHMVKTQTTMALKTENLTKASTLETYQAQFTQITSDPRVRQQLVGYYNQVQRMLPGNMKPEYAAGGILVLLLTIMYFIGFTKTLMALSLLLLLGVIIGPDLLSGDWKVVLHNFPRRCRETIETSAPFLRGKRFWNNRIAMGIVLVMLAFSTKALVTPTKRPAASFNNNYSAPSPSISQSSSSSIEDAYKLGFDDATKGLEFGTSMPNTQKKRSLAEDDEDEIPYDYTSMPPPASTSSSSPFGFSQVMSIFFLYRTATQLGGNPLSGQFSMEQFMLNVKTMPVWQMGMLGFSFYNLVRNFIL